MVVMGNTPEPPYDTPEYRLIGLERIVSSIDEHDEGAVAFLAATVTFLGDGDMVRRRRSSSEPPTTSGTPGTVRPVRELDHLRNPTMTASSTGSNSPWGRRPGSHPSRPGVSTRTRNDSPASGRRKEARATRSSRTDLRFRPRRMFLTPRLQDRLSPDSAPCNPSAQSSPLIGNSPSAFRSTSSILMTSCRSSGLRP